MIKSITRAPDVGQIRAFNQALRGLATDAGKEHDLPFSGDLALSNYYLACVVGRKAVGSLLRASNQWEPDIDRILEDDMGNTTVRVGVRSVFASGLDTSARYLSDQLVIERLTRQEVSQQYWPWVSKLMLTLTVTDGEYVPPDIAQQFQDHDITDGVRTYAPHDICIGWLCSYTDELAEQAAQSFQYAAIASGADMRLLPARMGN